MLLRSIISFVAIVIASFAVTFLYALWILGSPPLLLTQDEAHVSRLVEGAQIVRRFVFGNGQQGSSFTSSINDDWIGLSSLEFADVNPDWRIISFMAEEVIVEEYCGEEPEGGFIRLERDGLYVYDGRPEGCHVPRGPLDVGLHELNAQAVSELARGVAFTTEMDLALIVEGVRAP